MRFVMNSLLLALSITFTFLLGETHVGISITTLCNINFQCMIPTWISPNKKMSVRESIHSIPLSKYISRHI